MLRGTEEEPCSTPTFGTYVKELPNNPITSHSVDKQVDVEHDLPSNLISR